MPPCATSVALPAVLSVTIDQIFFQCEIGKGSEGEALLGSVAQHGPDDRETAWNRPGRDDHCSASRGSGQVRLIAAYWGSPVAMTRSCR